MALGRSVAACPSLKTEQVDFTFAKREQDQRQQEHKGVEMTIGTEINPGWKWDDNFPFAQARQVANFLFISGQVAMDPKANSPSKHEVVGGDVNLVAKAEGKETPGQEEVYSLLDQMHRLIIAPPSPKAGAEKTGPPG